MRSLGVLLALLCLATACGSGSQGIRVTLTAQNHHPRPSESPSWHWGYCVKVRTVAGTSVASTIQLRILSGRTPVAGVGLVSLRKGYDRWCAAIGGEGNILDALPRGKKLVFQAVVTANGATVERNWPIVVTAGHIYTVREVRAAFAAQGIALTRERPLGWPSDAAALLARHEVFVEVLFHEPGVWGGPGSAHVASAVSAHNRFTQVANVEAWWSPSARTAVERALARFHAP
jgi:hypothetical protein